MTEQVQQTNPLDADVKTLVSGWARRLPQRDDDPTNNRLLTELEVTVLVLNACAQMQDELGVAAYGRLVKGKKLADALGIELATVTDRWGVRTAEQRAARKAARALADLRKAGFENREPYPGNVSARWAIRCSIDGHELSATLSEIRQGRTCRQCRTG